MADGPPRQRDASSQRRDAPLSQTARAQADALDAELASVGTPERAASERAYLKSDLRFHGTTVWQIERAVKHLEPPADHGELIALVDALWSDPVHERRMAAVMLLERHRTLLSPGDLSLVERLIRESKTWAYVDVLAANVAGPVAAGTSDGEAVLDRWATDADFWVRRSALLSQLAPLKAGAPLDRFAGYADRMLDERQFFIRKAIGWVLRETGKRRPAEVVAWLAPRTHRASGVTMREAVRWLPAADGERLMAAYKEHRPAV